VDAYRTTCLQPAETRRWCGALSLGYGGVFGDRRGGLCWRVLRLVRAFLAAAP